MCKQAIYVSYLILIAPIAILKITFLKKSDDNALHESKMSGEKLIAWATERNSGHVNTVKKIKNTIPNTRFSDVLFACISASFFSYFKKVNSFIIQLQQFSKNRYMYKPYVFRKVLKLLKKYHV